MKNKLSKFIEKIFVCCNVSFWTKKIIKTFQWPIYWNSGWSSQTFLHKNLCSTLHKYQNHFLISLLLIMMYMMWWIIRDIWNVRNVRNMRNMWRVNMWDMMNMIWNVWWWTRATKKWRPSSSIISSSISAIGSAIITTTEK